MRHHITSQTYDELYAGLLRGKGWFQSVGLPISGNRFGTILANVDLIRQHYGKPSLNDVLQDHPMHELWISLLDAGSFTIIAEQLQNLRSDELPRGRMKEAMSGPLLPHDEEQDGASIQARDALFELELGSRLQARGVSIRGFDDIKFGFDGGEINVQCKRLHSPKTLQQNLDKACSQIAKRIVGTKTRGLVAIGMDKILETDRNIWTVPNEDSLLKETKDLMRSFLHENGPRFRRIVDIRVLGILADLRFMALVKDHNDLLTRGYKTALYPLASAETLQFADSDFLRRLGKKIADSAE